MRGKDMSRFHSSQPLVAGVGVGELDSMSEHSPQVASAQRRGMAPVRMSAHQPSALGRRGHFTQAYLMVWGKGSLGN